MRLQRLRFYQSLPKLTNRMIDLWEKLVREEEQELEERARRRAANRVFVIRADSRCKPRIIE